MLTKNAGFSLIELLVSITVMSIISAAMVSTFVTESRTSVQQERLVQMEANLRAATLMVGESIRNAGFGVPNGNLNLWITTVAGFTNFPVRITGGAPNTLDTASCTSQPMAQLTAAPLVGATTLTVDTAAPFPTNDLIWIGFSQFARVTGVGGTLTIDTNPGLNGAQGITRPFPQSTPLCRVDISTFTVDTANRRLLVNRYANGGLQMLAEDISNLQVTTITPGRRYQLAITGQTTNINTGALISRTLTSDVAVVN
jgi:prepilin-type N-terminal cleavage/methylation domain-containing protein